MEVIRSNSFKLFSRCCEEQALLKELRNNGYDRKRKKEIEIKLIRKMGYMSPIGKEEIRKRLSELEKEIPPLVNKIQAGA